MGDPLVPIRVLDPDEPGIDHTDPAVLDWFQAEGIDVDTVLRVSVYATVPLVALVEQLTPADPDTAPVSPGELHELVEVRLHMVSTVPPEPRRLPDTEGEL